MKVYERSDGAVFPMPAKGRPQDQRYHAVDMEAADDVIAGTFRSGREAAVAYLIRYDGMKAAAYDIEYRNERLRDIARRIDRRVALSLV